MAFCVHCGFQLAENSRFCTRCGSPVVNANTPINAPVPAVANSAPEGFAPNTLIQVYVIPEQVKKQLAKYHVLELYSDRLIGKGSQNGDITYFFKNYIGITWTPASIATQFAQLVFLTPENSSNFVSANNLNSIVDMNKIPFCSGMFSYQEANNYTKMLYLDIKAAMDRFKEYESTAATTQRVQVNVSSADELKKFKELLDAGVITQEEFEAKKRQLLGL